MDPFKKWLKEHASITESLQGSELRPIALMFTDLVGSTKLYQQRGDAAARKLVQRHNSLLKKQLEKFNGNLIKTIGDAFMVTFPKPKKALGCAFAVQRIFHEYNQKAPPADRLHLRIGVHYGHAIVEKGDVFGDVVNTAARIEAKAQGDEVFTSLGTWQTAKGLDTEVENLGDFELKGIADKVSLVKVLWDTEEIEKARKRHLERELLPEIAGTLLNQKCVLVIGGLTLGPRGGTVNRKIARKLALDLGIDERRDDLATIAGIYEEQNDREELFDAVAHELLAETKTHPEILQAIAELPVNLIITTDLDGRIEKAIAEAGEKAKKIVDLTKANPAEVEKGEVALIKLFGDWEHPESLALTEVDISRRLQQLSMAPEELQGALATGHLLFMGFRWNDRRFRQVFSSLTANTDPGLIRATGISHKVGAGARGTWRDRGLLLAGCNEIDFAQKLIQALAEQEKALQKERESSKEHLVQVGGKYRKKRPYKFLSYFEENDEEIFFGRTEETRKLFSMVVSHRLSLLHAPSGTGKTSLLNAGVIPKLKREGYAVTSLRTIQEPEKEIREGVVKLVYREKKVAKGDSKNISGEWFVGAASSGLTSFLQVACEVLGKPLVIVLDQFEEFFLRFPKRVRKAFAQSLSEIIKEKILNVRFVLSMRDDFLSRLSEFKSSVPDIFYHDLCIGPLTAEGLEQAIEEPAKLASLSYESGLVSQMVFDLGGEVAEPPQLQIICDRLYDELTENETEIRNKHYEMLGGAKGILGSYLERFISTRTSAGRELGKQVLKSLITSMGTKGVVTSEMIAQDTGNSQKSVKGMLSVLSEARLVRNLVTSQGENYELSHEYLIEEISRWIEEKDKDLKKARELLRQEMINHEQFGLLIAPKRIEIIQAQKDALNLTDEEKRLLNESIRSHRKKRTWMASAAAVLVCFVIAASVGIPKYLKLDLCKNSRNQLMGIWDAGVKQNIKKTFLATGLSYAEDTVVRVIRALDKYADGWVTMHTEACRAAQIDGTQSMETMDLRMMCLEKRRREQKALQEVFSKADNKVVQKSVKAAMGLDSISRCADVDALVEQAQRIKPPKDEVTTREVEETREKIAKVKALQESERYMEGLKFAKEVVAMAEKTGYLPVQAESMLELGKLQVKAARYEEARKTFEETALIADKSRHDRIRARALNNLVFTIGFRLEQFREIEKWNRLAEAAVVRLDDKGLIEADWLENSGIFSSFVEGDYYKSLQYYQEVLRIREKVLGKEHPEVAESLDMMGGAYDNKGDYDKALKCHNEAFRIRKKVFGIKHPKMSGSFSNLGIAYYRRGNCDEALKYIHKALLIKEKVFGKEHPLVASCLNNLGNVYSTKGDYDKAIQYHKEVLRIFERSIGRENPEVADILNNLGGDYANKGDYNKALQYHKEALGIREKVLGKKHPDFVSSLNNLGVVFEGKRNYERALQYYYEALGKGRKILGKEHPKIALVLENIGDLYESKGEYDKALQYYQESLRIREKVLGKEHPDVASSLNNLGLVYKNKGDYDKAIQYHQEALRIGEKAFGKEHPDVALSLCNLGHVNITKKRFAAAENKLIRAKAICEKKTCQKDLLPELDFGLTQILWKKGGRQNRDQAVELAKKAWQGFSELKGADYRKWQKEVEEWMGERKIKF